MPYRLRISFAPGAARTLTCDKGSFALTGKSNAFSYVPVSVSADVWTKLSTISTVGDSRAGPKINQGWTKAAINTSDGSIFLSQGSPAITHGGNFIFSTSLGYWVKTNTNSTDWHRSLSGIAENYDIVHDPVRSCYWRTSGGPFSAGNTAGPYYGDGKYNIATDEWSTPYPASDCTYTALPSDAGYFGTPGNSLTGFDSRLVYYNDCLYQFGAFSVSTKQNLKKRDIATGTITNLISYPSVPPWTSDARTPHLQGGFDTRTKKIYTLANSVAYWECSLLDAAPVWTAIATTGTTPNVAAPSAYPSYTGGDFGFLSVIDEAANCMVVWCGKNAVVQADGGVSQRKTWLLDLASREWRVGPSFAAGYTVPPAEISTMQSLMYDPVNKRTVLTVGQDQITEVWALQIAPVGGKITSWPLPSGATYTGYPYTSDHASKHTNMAYCPLDGRLYVTGGDTPSSATNGTWSMSLDDGSWRRDQDGPVYPTTPAPYALQDNAGFEWCASRSKFIVWPGWYYPYPPPIDTATYPIMNYSMGFWWFDPLTSTYTQDTTFFNGAYESTGCTYGGVYDEVNDHLVAFTDSTYGSKYCRRWDLTAGVTMSNLALTLTTNSTYPGFVFMRSKPVKIGRYVYVLGYRTDGTTAGQQPMMFRWHLDNHTTEELAAPPVTGSLMVEIEIRPAASNTKLVFPFVAGPEGVVIGLHVYNPANNQWTTDTKRPAYGNFIGNAICALPDGRVAFAGGVFGAQQTHMWFYEAT